MAFIIPDDQLDRPHHGEMVRVRRNNGLFGRHEIQLFASQTLPDHQPAKKLLGSLAPHPCIGVRVCLEIAHCLARAILVDVETEIDSVFLRARSRLEQFRTGYDESKPWSPARRKAFREGAEATVREVVDDVSAAIEEAAQRLSVELGNAGQQIAGHIAKALRAIDLSEADVVGRAVRIEGIADRLLQNVDAEFLQLLDAADGTKGKLAELQEKIDNHPSFNPPPKNEEIKARLDQGIAALTTGVTAAATKLSIARTAAKNFDTQIDEAAADFEGLVETVTATLKDIGAGITGLAAVLVDETQTLIDIDAKDLADDINELADRLSTTLGPLAEEVDAKLGKLGTAIDAIVKPMIEALDGRLGELHDELAKIPGQIAPIAEEISSLLSVAQNALSPAGLLKSPKGPSKSPVGLIIAAALEAILEPLAPYLDGAAATIAAARRQLGMRCSLYEALALWAGHGLMQGPIFGVAPCPTTIFTAGILLLGHGSVLKWLSIIPVLWAVVGTSAAVLLGITEDLGLGVAGIVLATSLGVRMMNKGGNET